MPRPRQPASRQLPHLQSIDDGRDSPELQADRVDIWYRNVLHGRDQLRQRVAFALSQIMVVSQQGVLVNGVYALADYYDMLVDNAFGNYRDLIEDVTLHPAMGVYLSMLGNEKPDPERNIRPDENYARELMQLFSIGLVELNGDGTDHGWGGNQVVVGGSVFGQQIYGPYPLLELGGELDVGGGRIIPSLSADQYAATLARWFGIPVGELSTVAPHIDNFAQTDLGFLV